MGLIILSETQEEYPRPVLKFLGPGAKLELGPPNINIENNNLHSYIDMFPIPSQYS
jgi:hypothetical protein